MSIGTKLRGCVLLIRPELPLAAGLCVVIGQFLALGTRPSTPCMSLGFLVGFLLSASAIATNDYFDLDVDRVNTPSRALPAGLLTPREAMTFGVAIGALGIALAWSLAHAAFGAALVLWCLGYLYNWRLKSSGLPGNLIVALSVAMTFVIGGISARQPWNGTVWLFAAIAFTFDLAEEIAGDAMDATGDRARGSRSLAIRWGKQRALRISATLFAVMLLLTWIPIVRGDFGPSYSVPIVLMNGLVIVFVLKLLRSRTPVEGRRMMRALYLSASLALLAFLVSALRD